MESTLSLLSLPSELLLPVICLRISAVFPRFPQTAVLSALKFRVSPSVNCSPSMKFVPAMSRSSISVLSFPAPPLRNLASYLQGMHDLRFHIFFIHVVTTVTLRARHLLLLAHPTSASTARLTACIDPTLTLHRHQRSSVS